jgi:hypothetical protein
MIHQLSMQATQNPFRKNRGRVSRVLFHPSKPFLLVATEYHVRVYNLVKQALARKLVGSSGGFTCLAIHSSGDHVLAGDPPLPVSCRPGRLVTCGEGPRARALYFDVNQRAHPPSCAGLTGSEDRRLAWYDLDLSTKPYKALRYHKAAVRGAAYHRGYPLFASSSDDGAVHVFHGMVYQVRDVDVESSVSRCEQHACREGKASTPLGLIVEPVMMLRAGSDDKPTHRSREDPERAHGRGQRRRARRGVPPHAALAVHCRRRRYHQPVYKQLIAWAVSDPSIQDADVPIPSLDKTQVPIRQSLQRIDDLLNSMRVPVCSYSHSIALYNATKPA